MLLINRDSVIFFCNFFIRIKIPQLCKTAAACSFMEGYRSPAAYAARLFLISILACRPNGRKR